MFSTWIGRRTWKDIPLIRSCLRFADGNLSMFLSCDHLNCYGGEGPRCFTLSHPSGYIPLNLRVYLGTSVLSFTAHGVFLDTIWWDSFVNMMWLFFLAEKDRNQVDEGTIEAKNCAYGNKTRKNKRWKTWMCICQPRCPWSMCAYVIY